MKVFFRSYLLFVLLAGIGSQLHADQNLPGNVTITGGAASGNLNFEGDLFVAGTIDSFDSWTKIDNNELRFGGADGVTTFEVDPVRWTADRVN